MSGTGSGYDLATTTFSPDGRVFQVEYAYKAVEAEGSAIGIRCVDGVVLGVKKVVVSKMLLPKSNRRTHAVAPHAGMTLAGLAADARQLVNHGRKEAANYKDFYGHPIPGKLLAQRLAGEVHNHTLYWYLRPFGCSVLLASFTEEEGPALHQIEPSGVCQRHFAAAIGKNRAGANTELEKLDFEKVTVREAIKAIASIIHKLHDPIKEKEFELELSWVCEESKGKQVLIPENLLQEAEAEARAAREREDMQSDSDED